MLDQIEEIRSRNRRVSPGRRNRREKLRSVANASDDQRRVSATAFAQRSSQLFSDCFKDVEIARREDSARRFLDDEEKTPMNLSGTLKKLQKRGEPLIFYLGGIDLLCQLINDGEKSFERRRKCFFDLSLRDETNGLSD